MERSRLFEVLCTCAVHEENLSVRYDDREVTLPLALAARMDTFWSQLQRNKVPGASLFDGENCRLEQYRLQDGILTLQLGKSYYRHTLYSNEYHSDIVREWGEEYLAHTLGVSAVVLSSDNLLMIMKRSERVGEYPGYLDVFGGHINPHTDRQYTIPSPFLAIQSELRLELGIPAGAIRTLYCCGLIKNKQNQKPELIFNALSALSSDTLLQKARHAEEADEFSDILTIPDGRENLHNFMRLNENTLTPSAQGSIWLYGLSQNYW